MMDGMGATIMGRNMFGPIRGEWGDSDWKGWWGDVPPYHCPAFVLTHYPHDPIEMDVGPPFTSSPTGSRRPTPRRGGCGWPRCLDCRRSLLRPAGDRSRTRRRDRSSGQPGDTRFG